MILLEIITWIILGACFSGITFLFEYMIGNPWKDEVYTGNIFSFYGLWIRRNYDRVQASIDLNKPEKNAYTKLNYWKALGVCPYCLNVHVGWVFTLFFACFTELNWWGIFIALPASHVGLYWISDRFWD
jgi:hypothetical protein